MMESLLYTFLEPRGAMRSTQSPHLLNFEGVIAISSGATPAPTVSPLKDGCYKTEIEAIRRNLDPIRPDVVKTAEFNSLAEFTEQMSGLIGGSSSPYTLRYSHA